MSFISATDSVLNSNRHLRCGIMPFCLPRSEFPLYISNVSSVRSRVLRWKYSPVLDLSAFVAPEFTVASITMNAPEASAFSSSSLSFGKRAFCTPSVCARELSRLSKSILFSNRYASIIAEESAASISPIIEISSKYFSICLV